MSIADNYRSMIPKAFLGPDGQESPDLHIHTSCGGSFPIDAYRVMIDGKRAFNCSECKCPGPKISVRPNLPFNRAKEDFFRKFFPKCKKAIIDSDRLEGEVELFKKQVLALAEYRDAKRFFKDKKYDNTVNICIIGLNLLSIDKITNEKLETLLLKAHGEVIKKQEQDLAEVKGMYEDSDKIESVTTIYNGLVIKSKIEAGLVHKQLGDIYFKMSKNLEAMNSFNKAKADFEFALGVEPLPLSKTTILDGLSQTYQRLAEIHLMRNEYAEAITNFQNAIRIDEGLLEKEDLIGKYGIKKRLNSSYLGLVDVYNSLCDKSYRAVNFPEAKKQLERSAEILKKIQEDFVDKKYFELTKELFNIYTSKLASLPDEGER
ncbi:MAG: hypothetical protein K940chlam7_01910 [Chlamydiae bacterium]|nr:hypothetical protein [Chlamydiota bacterium]